MSSGTGAVRAWLWDMTSFVKQYPALYLPLVRYRRRVWDRSFRRLERGTELVIDAFPRCGNTFAFHAFRLAQRRPVKVGHHFHAGAVIASAARRRIPVLTIIRDPESAVLSYLIFRDEWCVGSALREYVRYYRVVQKHRGAVCLATFPSVVSDYGRVVEVLNSRFGTSFVPFEHDEENVRRVHDEIDAIEEGRRRSEHRTAGRESWRSIPWPDERRAILKRQLQSRYGEPRYASLRHRAESLYERLAPVADV